MITVDQIMRWQPCGGYPRAKVQALVGDGVTPEQISRSDIQAEDKVWVLLHEPILTSRQLHLIACDVAEITLDLVRRPDPRSINAPRVKRLWLEKLATDRELWLSEVAAESHEAVLGAEYLNEFLIAENVVCATDYARLKMYRAEFVMDVARTSARSTLSVAGSSARSTLRAAMVAAGSYACAKTKTPRWGVDYRTARTAAAENQLKIIMEYYHEN